MEPIIAAAFAKPAIQLATKLLKPLTDALGKEVSMQVRMAYHEIFNAYSEYLEKSYERHSYFHSVVFKNEQKKLLDYYLPLKLDKGDGAPGIEVATFPNELMSRHEKLLIVDTAGMGKTTLSKFIFLKCVEEEASIPIYVELRRLSKKLDLLGFISESLSSLGRKCNPDLLLRLLDSGKFLLILDGYDEIPEGDRTAVTLGLQTFVEKAPRNKYILTSREETGLTAFAEFQRVTIKALILEEAFTLLKMYGNDALSSALIEKLKLEESAPIHEFLTNPLLTSLLYKSFEFKNVIPLKRHIFYRQVYEALFETHDLTKQGGEYYRSKRSGLDIDRFETILKSFGAFSYQGGQVELTSDELLRLLDRAKKVASEQKVATSSIAHDLTHAVPLMVQDGNYVRWTHRSIQEYFAALYICRDTKNSAEILSAHLKKSDFSRHVNLLTLCADIDGATFKRSIMRDIATEMLAKHEALFAGDRSKISVALIEERKSYLVARDTFFVRSGAAPVPELGTGMDKFHQEVILPLLEKIAEHSEHHASVGSSLQYGEPGLGKSTTPLEGIVDLLFLKVDLPFITPVVSREAVSDQTTAHISFARIDDDLTTELNQPENFALVNRVLKCGLPWSFNAEAAKTFLKMLDDEAATRDLLKEW